MPLMQPASPDNVADQAETKRALKALRHKRRVLRRWHHYAIVALDVIVSELTDALSDMPLRERPNAIAKADADMAPFLWPDYTSPENRKPE